MPHIAAFPAGRHGAEPPPIRGVQGRPLEGKEHGRDRTVLYGQERGDGQVVDREAWGWLAAQAAVP